MAEKIINVQDAFLNYIRKNKVPVTIFLLNGVKLTGVIGCFDQGSIVLKREGYMQLIYKHAISTFYPHGPVNLFEWNNPVSPIYNKKEEQNEESDELDNIDEEIDEIDGEYDHI
jgi:host factor-I protein